MIKILFISLLILTYSTGICQDSTEKRQPADLLKYTFLDSVGNKIYDKIYDFSEAEFPGGKKEMDKYIANYVKENLTVRKEDVNTIYFNVQFKVAETGKLIDIELYIKNDPYYDNQLIEVFKNMPDWTPATISGETVTQVLKHSFGIPIKHTIE